MGTDPVVAEYERVLGERLVMTPYRDRIPSLAQMVERSGNGCPPQKRALVCGDRAVRVFAVIALKAAGLDGESWASGLTNLTTLTSTLGAFNAGRVADLAQCEVEALAKSLDSECHQVDEDSTRFTTLAVQAACTHLVGDALYFATIAAGEAGLACVAAEAATSGADSGSSTSDALFHSIASARAAAHAAQRADSAAGIRSGHNAADLVFDPIGEGIRLLEDLIELR